MLHLLLVLGCAGETTDSADTADTAGDTAADVVGDATVGAGHFTDTCAGCHGADGTGGIDIGGTPSADLTARVPALTDAELEDRITNGFNTAMPAQFNDAQDVADVIAYLRATFP